MPVLPVQRRLSTDASLRDRRWSTIVWKALVPLAPHAQASGPTDRLTAAALMVKAICSMCAAACSDHKSPIPPLAQVPSGSSQDAASQQAGGNRQRPARKDATKHSKHALSLKVAFLLLPGACRRTHAVEGVIHSAA